MLVKLSEEDTLENETTSLVLEPLYKDSQEDAKPYLKAWKEFYEIWRIYAEDILLQAEKVGIKDDNPLSNEINEITSRLATKETSLFESGISRYFTSYWYLVKRFNDLGKSNLLMPKHFESSEAPFAISPSYDLARNEWDKFDRSREERVWWAHYQICRLAAAVFDLSQKENYFNDDYAVDGFYKYEFAELAKGNLSSNPIVLHANKYRIWIKRLHEYLIPRLEAMGDMQPILKPSIQTQPVKADNHASFDSRTSKIKLLGKDIPISKNTNEFELCNAIFKNQSTKEKEWSSDEMVEKWGGNYDYDNKNAWRKVYNAARQVNGKVAAKTTIDNLLLITTKTIQLNPSYL